MVCVACTAEELGACAGMTPICDVATNTCVGCAQNSDCPDSGACTPDGSCAEATDVAYVQGGAGGGPCTLADPCDSLEDAIGTGRDIIKFLTGDPVEDNSTTTLDRDLLILADPGAVLDRTGDGAILSITSGNVRIEDLTISGATSGGAGQGVGIVINTGNPTVTLVRVIVQGNAGRGLVVDAGTLVMSRSTVINNDGGAMRISEAQFDISNSFFVKNGEDNLNTTTGGIQLVSINAGTRRFEFNTVANNERALTGVTGVECALVETEVAFKNNIVFGNIGASTTQVDGANCVWTFSNIGPIAEPGTGNTELPPLFEDVGVGNNFHILAGSPAIDAAEPAATEVDDFDGLGKRPTGAGMRRDMGADERP
jgi:hypothetical protein